MQIVSKLSLFMLKILVILSCLIFLTSSLHYQIAEIDQNEILITENTLTYEILDLRNRIDSIFENFSHLEYISGAKVISLTNNQILYEKNSDLALIPASNLKIITTAAAFNFLGSDFTWETSFYSSGLINNNTLEGDLYVSVQGDPTWNDRFKRNIIDRTFKSIADSLAKKGIRHIKGNIIIDPGTLHDIDLGFGWKDENKIHTYSAYPSAIAFYDNSIQVRINPTTPGQKARINIFPYTDGVEVVNKVTTTNVRRQQGFDFQIDSVHNRVIVSGRIYEKSRTQYRSLSSPRPELYSLTVFKQKLNEQNVKIKGDILYQSLSKTDLFVNNYAFLFKINSLPLTEIANEINKNSNNFMANQLFLTIGDRIQHVWQSENLIRQWLAENNIMISNFKMYDGSGLSVYNLASADLMVQSLKLMYNKPYFEDFFKSMAVSGVDGTLQHQFNSSELRRKVFAKTGTISGVRALSGYLITNDDELLAFSLMFNKANSKMNRANTVIEQILNELVRYERNNSFFVENTDVQAIEIN